MGERGYKRTYGEQAREEAGFDDAPERGVAKEERLEYERYKQKEYFGTKDNRSEC
jgi:hypothetical protein